MSNIFDIGVKLSLASNAGAGLRVLARDLMGIRGEIGKTQAAMNRLRNVMIGAGALTVGSAMLRGWWDLAKAGDRIIQQRQKMISQGLDLAAVNANQLTALKMAAAIEGTTVSQNMALITLLRSTVGTSAGARSIAPGAARDIWVLRHLGQSEGDIAALFKAFDMLGWGIDKATGKLDPQKFIHALDLMTGALNLMPHQILRGVGIYQFVRMAQPLAAVGGNPLQFIRDTFELMAQLGRTGGRGIAYMGIKLLGGQLTKAQEQTLLRMGLVAPSGIGGTREHPALKPGAIVGYQELINKGLLAWIRDVFFPRAKVALGGHGSPEDISKLLNALAGFPVTSQRTIGTLLNILPMVKRFNEQLDKEIPHLDETFNTLQTSVVAQLGDLDAALSSFFEVLGVPAAQFAIPFLKDLTGGIQDLTLTLGENPWLAQIIDDVAMAFGLFLGANGGIMVLRGALGMLKLTIPQLSKAFIPFAEGGAAAMALRVLTSKGGLLALAFGIEALSKSVKDIPPWLTSALEAGVTTFAATKNPTLAAGATILAAGIGGAESGSPAHRAAVQWNLAHPLAALRHPAHEFPLPPMPPAGIPAAIPGLPLPPLPPPLPLPPIPSGGIHVSVSSPVSVTLPLPPMSPADLRYALQQALIQGIDPNTLSKIADMIAKDQITTLKPLLDSAIRQTLHHEVDQQQKHLKRRTFAPTAPNVAAMGGL